MAAVKVKRVPKYKSQMKILDSGAIQGACSCGWIGNAFVQDAGLSVAMTTVQGEIQSHKHLPKVKKVKK